MIDHKNFNQTRIELRPSHDKSLAKRPKLQINDELAV